MIFGIIVAILPLAGFPSTWDNIISVVIGIFIIIVAYVITPPKTIESADKMPFVEHKNGAGDINNSHTIN